MDNRCRWPNLNFPLRIPIFSQFKKQTPPDPWWLRAILVLVGAYVIWHLAGWAPQGSTPALAADFSVLELLCVTACWTLVQASRRIDFPPPFRAGLRWIAGAMGFQSAGGGWG